ncbi:hypothetical protein D9M71_447080 [compost metagenome]
MEAARQGGGQVVVRGVQEHIRGAAFLDPGCDLVQPGQQEGFVSGQLRMADEAYLRGLAERRRARWYPRLFRLGVKHRRRARNAAEQGARIQANAFYPSIKQEPVEHSLLKAPGKECRVPDFHRQGSIEFVDKAHQLRQLQRRERRRQLQPEWRDPLPQRLEQCGKIFGRIQLLAQVTAMADVAGELGREAKVLGHALGPALNRRRCWAGVEGGIALDGIEYLGIQGEKIGGFGVVRIKVLAPGVFTPGRTTQKIR